MPLYGTDHGVARRCGCRSADGGDRLRHAAVAAAAAANGDPARFAEFSQTVLQDNAHRMLGVFVLVMVDQTAQGRDLINLGRQAKRPVQKDRAALTWQDTFYVERLMD